MRSEIGIGNALVVIEIVGLIDAGKTGIEGSAGQTMRIVLRTR